LPLFWPIREYATLLNAHYTPTIQAECVSAALQVASTAQPRCAYPAILNTTLSKTNATPIATQWPDNTITMIAIKNVSYVHKDVIVVLGLYAPAVFLGLDCRVQAV